jgi:hypothetical protein
MAASERDPAARDPLATAHPGSAATAIPAEPVVLARLDGHAVEEAEYRAFLDRVRARGYRPATMDEARRLLRVQLREKALELEAERRLSGEPANVEQVYRELLRDAAGAEGAPDGEVSRSPDRPLARARAREWSRVQREIVLERLLVRSRLEIDVDALRSFVDDRRAEGPQRPPVAFAPGAS